MADGAPPTFNLSPSRSFLIILIEVLRHDRFTVCVQKRSESAAVPAVDKEIVDAGFLVYDDDGVRQDVEPFPLFDVESVRTHNENLMKIIVCFDDKYSHFPFTDTPIPETDFQKNVQML